MSEETSAIQKSSDSSGDFLASRDNSNQQFGLAAANLIPPQNIEVEEAILGGILLDPEAYGRVAELLVPNAFYIPAHGHIYQAAIELHASGLPTDLLNVSNWLADNQLLEKVGGQNKLVQLVERTVSAVNVDSLAVLLMDKYMRRELIQAGNVVGQLGYDMGKPLEQVLDQAEQKVLNVTQVRPQSGLTPVSEIVLQTYQDIEARHQELTPPGLTCDFADLDAMTGGFQRSDLIIVAGRPSMGKCLAYDSEIVLADGSISSIESLYQQQDAQLLTLQNNWQFKWTRPSNYVDDGIKPVFRVKTSLGREIETTLTHPFLTLDSWQPLSALTVGEKIAVPRVVPVFGQDPLPECAVKILGYLIGDSNLERILKQDKVAEILHLPSCPNPSLTLLPWSGNQTGAESFSRKSTKRSLLPPLPLRGEGWGEGECNEPRFKLISSNLLQRIPHFTNINPVIQQEFINAVQDIEESTLKNWLKSWDIRSELPQNKLVPKVVFQLPKLQLATFLNCLFASGGWIKVTGNEQPEIGFETASKKLAQQVQHLLLRFGVMAGLTFKLLSRQDLDSPGWQINITDAVSIHTFMAEIGIGGQQEATTEKIPLQALAQSQVYWDEIVAIESVGCKQVYDLTIPDTHNFVANDICVHNTAISLNIAYNMALLHQLPILVFSLEMSKEQLVQRMLAGEARVDSNRLRAGRISQNEWEQVYAAIAKISELPIYIDDTANMMVMQMRSQARRLQAETGKPLGLIMLDYLQLMEGSSDNRVQEISKITRSLKGLARELNVPIIALSQLSRSVESRNNKRPMMSDLRESGSIEQDADLVIMLYRDAYYNPDTPDRDITELIVTKHRNGPTGVVKLVFDPGLTKFKNLAQPR
jgi:replicative DNA helicase